MKLVNTLLVSLLLISAAGTVMADEPPTVTCAQVQQYQGVFEGDRVRVNGIVTVESARYGYAITNIADPGGGPWAGLAIYDSNQLLVAERGNTISVVGIITEYYDKTELVISDETEFPPQITGNAQVPAPSVVTCNQADEEQYENVLIQIYNLEVLSDPDSYGSIAVSDGTAEYVLLLRSIDPAPAIGYVYDCIIGDDDYHFGEFKIRPRDENDWTCGTPPTATPSAPTATPTPDGPTPTATPTNPGGPCDPVMTLAFQGHSGGCFQGGDNFHATFDIENTCDNDRAFDMFLLLQVADYYYWYPTWGEGVDSAEVLVRANNNVAGDILAPFSWPTGVGAYDNVSFIGAIADPGTFNLQGNIPILDFCYE